MVIHKDLDLTVQRGEVLSIVGGSGSGKTVLLRQILGLEQPGRRARCGSWASRCRTLSRRGASSRIGMLFQHGALFSAFSVLENIAFPLRELKTLPPRLVHEAAMVKLQMVGLKPERRRQDAVRAVRRHDQARGAGAGADHGPAAAAAGRAHGRAGPGQLRRLRARCCARCTATWR